MRHFLVFLFVAAALAQAPKSAFDKKAMEAYVRHLRLYTTQVTVTVGEPKASEVPGFKEVTVHAQAGQAAEDATYLVSNDGQKILEATVYDIKQNPFAGNLAKLKTDFQPSMGTPGAPVVIVIFTDFQCPYCQKEAETLRKELLTAFPTQVRVYFKDMPIPQIHPWAMTAAVAGRCVFRQKATAFWDYHDFVFGKQTEITVENIQGKIEEFVKAKNLDLAQLNACTASKSALSDVEKSVAEGRGLGVTSTPTLFINGRKIPGYVQFANLKQIIDFEVGYQAVNKNAGEHCCTLPVPGLLNPSANPVLPR